MRIASVIAGIFLMLIMYIAASCFAMQYQAQISPQSEELPAWISGAFLIFFPVAFFLASLVTGFLAQPYIGKSFGEILFISPGLYCVLLGSMLLLHFFYSADSMKMDVLLIAAWIGVGLLSITTSALGVLVGYILRVKIAGSDQPQETWRL